MSCHVMCQVNKLEFGYPGCESLYSEVDFGVDLDSRIALVGPNGAGACRVVSCRVSILSLRPCVVFRHSVLRTLT